MRIGIDLGGTKIEGILLDPSGTIITRKRVPTPPDYPSILAALVDLAAYLESVAASECSLGLCTPGSANPLTGRLRNSNAVALNGRLLRRDLENILEKPVRIANDADCFALSEAIDGAGADDEVVFGVIIGTGVGGGLVVRQRLWPGRNRIAGEWGHNPLPWPRPDELPGPLCFCGHRGCIDAWLGGPALAADAGLPPEHLDASHPALERWLDRFARSLATIINLLDPDVIVLGGGLSNLPGLYQRLPARLAPHVFSDAPPTTAVRPAVHGPTSGVRGAAWLWGQPD